MDQETLVGPDIREGKSAVSALEQAGLTVKAAYWTADALWELSLGSGWRLILITPDIDRDYPRKTYLQVRKILDKYKVDPVLDYSIYSTSSPIYKSLRRQFKGERDKALRYKVDIEDHTIGPGYLYFVD